MFLSRLHGHFWFHSVIVHNTPPHAGIRGLTIRNSGVSEFYHYSRFSSWPIYLSWDNCAQQEGCSLSCDTVSRKNKNPHVLTTGNSPVDQGVWCLVEDSIWCHSGTGVQHNIKSTHKETYRRGNSDECTVMENPRSHRRGLCSPSPFHFTFHSKMQIYISILTLVSCCKEQERFNSLNKTSTL